MRLSRPVLALRALLVGTIVVHGPGCFLDAQGLPMEGGQPSGGDGPGGGGAGDGGAPPVCLTPADCGSPSVCSAFECNGGSCDTEAEPLNTNCGDQGTEVCDGNGMCLTVDGEDCAAASECLSGFCADGVCCDVVCAGPCNSCALPTAGACTPYTVDTDPDDECPGVAPGTGVCDGASGCADGTVAASGSFSDDAVAQAVATYANGDAVIVGDFQGPLSLGTGALPGSPSRDAFVVRLAADGSHVWSRGFGEGGDQTAFGAAVDSTGAVIVGGPFAGGINLDDGFGPRDSLGANDGFLVKLDAVGATVWGNAFGDGLEQVVIGVGVDEQDAVYIAGYFSGTVNFGPTVTTTLTSAGLLDVFIAKFTSAGDHEWSKRFGDAANQFSTGFAVNADGECAITGAFDGVMQFGTGDLISAGYDVFVAQLDSDGEPVFSSSFGDVSAQRSHAVAIDPLGQVAVVGDYVGTMCSATPASTSGALPSAAPAPRSPGASPSTHPATSRSWASSMRPPISEAER